MTWLTNLFSGKDSTKAEQKAKKRESQSHSQRVRAREKELRRGKEKDGKRASFFWGSPGQTYENNVRGPGEGV
ncbi:uncharacterized protein N7500_008177 [Penicillium coprophilum]|uniref:uncharacterized protein n=1 Tax=Penicillium coprophilum TaxID=36646 RepID=UPI002397C251|nr:uncharacterized protein N7500_008177 [Penicillium coprophilum]KAJ5158526.1 hypothetical protein N7500_008177 [Penicillium coprophilum]